MIQTVNLDFSIHKKKLLSAISCQFPQGQLTGLIGPNGAGKTTLLKLIAGINTPTAGYCYIDKKTVQQYSYQQRSLLIGYLAQKNTVAWPMTVAQVVALGLLPLSVIQSEQAALIHQALVSTEVEHLKTASVADLSGGELARVLLARVLITNTPIILADEPIASLDPYHQLKVLTILKRQALSGKTVIISLHDINFAQRFCDHIVLLKAGKLVAEGAKADIIQPEIMSAVYDIEMQLIEDKDQTVFYPALKLDS